MLKKNKHPNWNPSFWNEWLRNSPVLCVDLVLVSDNKILLSKRNTQPFKDHWHLPGGVVRKGETLELTVKRVAKTELGIKKIDIERMIDIFDNPNRDPRGHFITVAFKVSTEEKISKIGSQNEELAFFDKLPKKIGFDAKEIIDIFLKQKQPFS